MNATVSSASGYEELQSAVVRAGEAGARVRLRKNTSNLFRRRLRNGAHELDVRHLNSVLYIDPRRRIAEVEGMLTYEDFVSATLPYNLVPMVVPQLKTITVGGAVSGLGIESSSLRYGLVHETVESMDILTGDGQIVHCSRTENSDLFFGFPNSYGTLGYALRLTIRLIPAMRYVHLTHTRFRDHAAFLKSMTASNAEYVDGTVFAEDEMYLTEGRFTDSASQTSDYTYMNIYYQSIRKKTEDWMTTKDYIWRWDTDWFWCSKQFKLQNRGLRWLAKPWLNSRSYQSWMRLAQRYLPDTGKTESVIQDVQIPLENAGIFFSFLLREVPIKPIWICPFRTFTDPWTLTALGSSQTYVNFGFWDIVPARGPAGSLNRTIERIARELDGTKALYSSSYYDEAMFWTIYDQPSYKRLKKKTDPRGVFADLFGTVGNKAGS